VALERLQHPGHHAPSHDLSEPQANADDSAGLPLLPGGPFVSSGPLVPGGGRPLVPGGKQPGGTGHPMD
jgi:hypothetical protein